MNATGAARRGPVLLILFIGIIAALSLFLLPRTPANAVGAGGFIYNAAACAQSPDMPTSGWDYPQPVGAIPGWVARRDVSRERTHGWWLWAALNQQVTTPGGIAPRWRGWCTSTQAYAPTGGEPRRLGAAAAGAERGALALGANRRANTHASADPIQLPDSPDYPVPTPLQAGKCYNAAGKVLIDGASYANNTDVMLAGVIYNGPAYNWIRSQGLFLQSTLRGQMPAPGQIGNIAAMPRGSVVLKPMMWPVPASGYSALPVWDGPKDDHGVYAGFENQRMWPRAVAVTAQPQPGVTHADVRYLYGVKMHALPYGPIMYRQAPVVPISQFYAYKPQLAGMEACDRALLDATSIYAYGRPFAQGDYLVLIAMHIMTKEQPNWTFQSLWWSDRPNEGVYAKDRPIIPSAQGPWRHYLMDSTYGIGTVGTPGSWGTHFNPYIELAADHPIETNCMNCHHRAAWPTSAQAAPGMPSGQYLTNQPTDPGKTGILAQNNPIFRNLLLTDSQWSMPNRAKGLQAGPTAGPRKSMR